MIECNWVTVTNCAVLSLIAMFEIIQDITTLLIIHGRVMVNQFWMLNGCFRKNFTTQYLMIASLIVEERLTETGFQIDTLSSAPDWPMIVEPRSHWLRVSRS